MECLSILHATLPFYGISENASQSLPSFETKPSTKYISTLGLVNKGSHLSHLSNLRVKQHGWETLLTGGCSEGLGAFRFLFCRCCCCCCFSHSAHWLPARKKLLYTVADPARGLKKKKSGSAPPPRALLVRRK